MQTYTKLFTSILDSTIWQEPAEITNTSGGNATNLFNALALKSLGTISQSNTVLTITGLGLSMSVSSAWASLTSSASTTTPATNVVVPISTLDSGSRAPIESQLVSDIDVNSTNGFSVTSPTLSNYVALSTVQTISNKALVGGSITNATNNGLTASDTNHVVLTITFPGIEGGVDLPIPAGTNVVEIRDSAGTLMLAILNDGTVKTGDLGGVLTPFVATGSIAITNVNGLTFAPGANDIEGLDTITATNIDAFNASISKTLTVGTNITTNLTVAGSLTYAGVYTNLTTGGTNILAGNICYKGTNLTSLVNGNNTLLSTGQSYLVVSGPTGAFAITGVVAIGFDRQEITIENASGQTMTIANQSGAESAANRIQTGSGSDLALTSNPGEVTLVYNVTSSRWTIKSHN